jgi:TolB-like protein
MSVDKGEGAAQLRRIVHKCLAKAPRDRYQSMKDLVVDLREVGRRLEAGSTATVAAARPVVLTGPRWATIAAAAVALALMAGAVSYRAPAPPSETAGGARMRIAVLMFQNLGAPEDEYFAAGVTEEITGRLAGVSQLAVISSRSVLKYSNSDKSSQQIGLELNVDYILQGTVRWQPAKDGPGRVRVTPQLTRVADDTQIWADTYERRLDEIFAVQSDIAARVIPRLGTTVLAPERRIIELRPTENLEAYKEYLRGSVLFFHNYGNQPREDALAHFERAVALDPQFAAGHAAVAIAAAWRFLTSAS